MKKVEFLAIDFSRAMNELSKCVSKNSGRETLEKIKVEVKERVVDFFATDGYIIKTIRIFRQDKGECFEFCMYPVNIVCYKKSVGKVGKIEITKTDDELVFRLFDCGKSVSGFIQECTNEYLDIDKMNKYFKFETDNKIGFNVGRLKKILSTYKSNDNIVFEINSKTSPVRIKNLDDGYSEAIILPCRI